MNTKRYVVTTYAGQKSFTSYRLAKVAAKKIAAKTDNRLAFQGKDALAIISRRRRPQWMDGFGVGKPLYAIFLTRDYRRDGCAIKSAPTIAHKPIFGRIMHGERI